MHWVIDEYEIVHVSKHCESSYEPTTDYHPVKTVVTIEDMIAHLARPEVRDGHSAPGLLAPCDQCLLNLPLDIGQPA